MATINNIYVFVEKESMGRPLTVPQHAVETGLPLTDLVKRGAKTLSINGEIVDAGNLTADDIISKLENLAYNGNLIKYVGRENVGNFMIADFKTDKDKNIHGGATFDMELVEVRIAKSAYDPSKQQKNTGNVKLAVGSIVVFKGGSVYVSSDATTPAANRGRSTCKITIINERSWSKHDYHLISTDGGKVYGWVDVENIEGTGNMGTAPVTNAGTQQVQQTNSNNTSKLVSAGQLKYVTYIKLTGSSSNFKIPHSDKVANVTKAREEALKYLRDCGQIVTFNSSEFVWLKCEPNGKSGYYYLSVSYMQTRYFKNENAYLFYFNPSTYCYTAKRSG